MTSVVIEQLGAPAGSRAEQAADVARRRAVDVLAGRTVWCITTTEAGRPQADALCECMTWASDGAVDARRVDLELPAELWDLADPERYAEAARAGDGLAAADATADDVVVLQDPMAAALAHGLRDRGPHVVWQMGSEADWQLLEPETRGVDAYVIAWPGLGLAAIMSAPARVAAKRCADAPSARLRWSSVLADVVRDDRDETVGGTRHAKPAVAAR
jgi:hypothetical protein